MLLANMSPDPQDIDTNLCGKASNAVGSSFVASGECAERRAQEQGKSNEGLDDGHFGDVW